MQNRAFARTQKQIVSQDPLQPLLSVARAAEFLGISQSWLNKADAAGAGPTATLIGRRVLYDARDLQSWLASKKQAANSVA